MDCFNTSVNYYVYLHENSQQKPPGFYFLQVNYLTGHIALSECYSSPADPLWIQSTMKLYIMFYIETFDAFMKRKAKRAYDNYNQDCFIHRKYGRTYENHMDKVIDLLIQLQTDDNVIDRSSDKDIIDVGPQEVSNQPVQSLTDDSVIKKTLARDINDPNKTRGYIATEHTNYEFIGPDRATVNITDVSQYPRLANIVESSGLPNYRQVRIPITSGLNIEARKKYLHEYPDQKLIQYLQYGFPLSLSSPESLRNHTVKNHFSALQHPAAIQEYLAKEQSYGAILGPVKNFGHEIEHNTIHCSPLLTRPKDGDKRRVILDLSHPHDLSVNDQVDRLALVVHLSC